MAFVYEKKPSYRVYDPERDLELVTGPGAYGDNTCFFCNIGKPDEQLGGFRWREKNRAITEDERSSYAPTVKWIATLFVDGPWGGGGSLPIKGYAREDSIEIIKEAMLAHSKLVSGKYIDTIACEFELWPTADEWMKGDNQNSTNSGGTIFDMVHSLWRVWKN